MIVWEVWGEREKKKKKDCRSLVCAHRLARAIGPDDDGEWLEEFNHILALRAKVADALHEHFVDIRHGCAMRLALNLMWLFRGETLAHLVISFAALVFCGARRFLPSCFCELGRTSLFFFFLYVRLAEAYLAVDVS
jgi:hypothetical protein